jgi:hypothetical protein
MEKRSKIMEIPLKMAQIEGDHRFTLTRAWELDKPRCLWVMLNPSLADSEDDDPTIRRLIHFSKAHNYGGFYVVNLVSYITPKPDTLINWMRATKWHHPDNYWRKKNMQFIEAMYKTVGPSNVIFAWGQRGDHPLIYPTVQRVVSRFGVNAKMFELTVNNHPKHPLYLPNDSRLVAFPNNNNKGF